MEIWRGKRTEIGRKHVRIPHLEKSSGLEAYFFILHVKYQRKKVFTLLCALIKWAREKTLLEITEKRPKSFSKKGKSGCTNRYLQVIATLLENYTLNMHNIYP